MASALGVVVKRYPKLSETFVQGEIASLIAAGFDLKIISLYRPSDALQHPSSAAHMGRVSYLDGSSDSMPLVSTFFALLRAGPRAWRVLWRLERRARGLAMRAVRLLALSRHHGIAHLHAHCCSEPAIIADGVARLGGPGFSFTAHAKDLYLASEDELRNLAARADFVTTCTQHNLRHLQKVAAPEKVRLVYHGIDTQRFAPSANGAERAGPLIISVGRLKEKKGFDVLLRACARLHEQGVDFRLRIYGYGDQHDTLVALIDAMQLGDRAELLAPVTHAELPRLLRSAAVFAMPCRILANGDRDGIPNALLEGMAAGLAVVSTPISGITEVVQPGVNGLLVPSDNADALAGALTQLLSDATLRARLGDRARATVVQQFSWQRNIATLVELLAASLARDGYEALEAVS